MRIEPPFLPGILRELRCPTCKRYWTFLLRLDPDETEEAVKQHIEEMQQSGQIHAHWCATLHEEGTSPR